MAGDLDQVFRRVRFGLLEVGDDDLIDGGAALTD